jgi:hypothetical protein
MHIRALPAAELLACWEQCLAQPPLQRALTLLGAASPETAPDTLEGFSIGQRDAGLLAFRAWTFGRQLNCLASCPACAEQLELAFDIGDIWAPADAPPEALSASIAGYTLRFRLPNSLDLAAIADCGDLPARRRLLLERCLLAAERDGDQAAAADLPADVVRAMAESMAQADPQADVQLALACPGCGHQWQAGFDIESFIWSEIKAWAARALREVHTLATAYCWSESEILALSPLRRQL